MNISAAITAVHGSVPEKVLSNSDLEKWSIQMMNGSLPELGLKREE